MVTCAPISSSAPPLAALVQGAHHAFRGTDRIASIEVVPGAHEVRVLVRRPHGNTDSIRGQWQASLLLEAVHVAACNAGRRPETRDTITTVAGTPSTLAVGVSMPVRPFPVASGAAFAAVDPAFRARLARAASQFGFRVRSVAVLRNAGDAAQIRIESDAPRALIASVSSIDGALAAPGLTCDAVGCLTGFYLEADDASGRPFMVVDQVTSLPSGRLLWGGQWVRDGLPYPFDHG